MMASQKGPNTALCYILRHCGVPEYASFLSICAPCLWAFLLSHPGMTFYETITNSLLIFLRPERMP